MPSLLPPVNLAIIKAKMLPSEIVKPIRKAVLATLSVTTYGCGTSIAVAAMGAEGAFHRLVARVLKH